MSCRCNGRTYQPDSGAIINTKNQNSKKFFFPGAPAMQRFSLLRAPCSGGAAIPAIIYYITTNCRLRLFIYYIAPERSVENPVLLWVTVQKHVDYRCAVGEQLQISGQRIKKCGIVHSCYCSTQAIFLK